MALKKSELYSSLWKSCDELRGGMDASQYKDYVLVLLFVKYVSDKYAGQKNALLDVPPGGSFADMLALKGDKEIGDKINTNIAKLAEANDLRADRNRGLQQHGQAGQRQGDGGPPLQPHVDLRQPRARLSKQPRRAR